MNTWNEKIKGWKPAHGFALLALGGLLLSSSAEAKRITVQQAQQNALNFMGKQLVQAQTSRSLTRSGKANDAYFVFNSTDGQGYVIVSGDDAVRPILGYSKTGKFDENKIPGGLKDLLASYQKQIESLGDNAPAYVQTRATEQTSEKVLTTAKWGENEPYNEYTPNHYPTGCAATAAAIVMKHFGYPAKGTGSHSYLWNGETELSVNFDDHSYDWDSMPLEYKKGENDDQFHGVARLMYDLGITMNMDYYENYNWGSILYMRKALIEYFGYSKFAKEQPYFYYTDSSWKEKIRENIDANRPVVYAADDEKDSWESHVFVIDGYKDNLFSVNWGWGGMYDGFYAIGQLAPNEKLNYNLNDEALFDLQPSDGKEQISPLLLSKDAEGYYGLNMNVTDVKADQRIDMLFGYLKCQAEDGFDGDLHICLTDQDGKIKEDIAGYPMEFDYGSVYRNVTHCAVATETDAAPGDRIAIFTQAKGSEEMIPVRGFDNSDISLPATGYAPRTCEVVITANEGATITPLDINLLYNGKVLLGSIYGFTVTPDNASAKSFVTLDGAFEVSEERRENCEDNAEGNTRTYGIYDVYKPSYAYDVKTYQDYAEKQLELDVTPGTLGQALKDQDKDYLVYRQIKLKGQIDQRDFEVLNKYPFTKIDLSECTVAAYENNEADCVPGSAFMGNETLDAFEMPRGVKKLQFSAFAYVHLKKITIPESMEEVDGFTFYNSPSLVDVYMYHTTPLDYNYSTFAVGSGAIAKRTLHVPVGCKSVYEDSAYQSWTRYFGNIVEDVETGIQGVTINAAGSTVQKKAVIYDLNGRRILTPVKNHTYIQGGKKFIQR